MKRISTCNVPEDENNFVQTRLSGEFWVSDVIMHKAHYPAQSHGTSSDLANCAYFGLRFLYSAFAR